MEDQRLQELKNIADKVQKYWEINHPAPTDEEELSQYEFSKVLNENILKTIAEFMEEYEKSKV